MSVVALPIMFGSRRFGKVRGGILDTDGLDYPQPGGVEIWQPGMSTLVAPPGTDAGVEAYGFKTNALLSGGNQQLYGKDIDGWIFCDTINGKRWLIQPDFDNAATDFDGALSITFSVVQFGLFDGNAALAFTDQTCVLLNWGQGSPDITTYGNCTNDPQEADLHLVSAKTDGSVAVLMASVKTNQPYQELPWIHAWPVGFLGVTCTAIENGLPTLALSVLRSRASTLGVRTDMVVSGGLTFKSVSCEGAETLVTYYEGSETFTQGVTNEILALIYENDVLVEITGNAEISGSNICPAPDPITEGFSQSSNGSVRLTWTLSNGTYSVSWYYELESAVIATVNCDDNFAAWTTITTETFNGDEATSSVGSSDAASRYLRHTSAETGFAVFAINTACRAPGDLWEDTFTDLYPGAPWITWGFRRYAYAVIGLYAEVNGSPVRGGCMTPTETIVAGSIGNGNYGAYNARTGEAVAGDTTAVSYV